jgi:D-3-phosphoglycerate dehydrogenase
MMMDKKEVLISMPTDLKQVVAPFVDNLKDEEGYTYKIVYSDEPIKELPLIEALENSAGYVAHLEKVTEKVFKESKNLKIVSKLGVGVDNIDRESAKKYGVEVSNCPGSNSNAVAELALGLMLTMARNVQKLCNELRSKIWIPEVGFELKGKTVGLLGFGNVSKQLARYLKPFDVEILAYDVFENKENEEKFGMSYVSLNEIAEKSDFISIHLPLLPTTKHIVDRNFISKTKKGVYILNLARGGVADEIALYDAVVENQVAMVATDVFETEPPFDSPFLADERYIVLPHIGAATKESILSMLKMAIGNIKSVLEGKGNLNPV